MFDKIKNGLDEFLNQKPKPITNSDRLDLAEKQFGNKTFSRKDYLKLFVDLSEPSGTRDLRIGVEISRLERIGMDRTSVYRFKKLKPN